MGSGLKAGLARVDITPEPGCEMAGMGKGNFATGIGDPLFARTLVLNDGQKTVALIAVDLIGMDTWITARVRAEMADEVDCLMVSASHTHYGPCARFILPYPEREPGYEKDLVSKLVEGIREAKANLTRAKVYAGKGRLGEAVNRRVKMLDGSLYPLGKLAHVEHLADGPVDTEVGVVRFGDEKMRAVGTFYNYAAHPICLWARSCHISADYPGAASAQLEHETGAVALFTNGGCGNIAPQKQMTGSQRAHQLGTNLAQEVLKTFTICEPIPATRLGFQSVLLPLPVRREIAEKWDMHERVRNVETVEGELNVCAFGEVALVGVPGEAFVEMALEIKERSPFKYTYLLYITNDDLLYIPTPQSYDQGGYEVSVAVLGPQAFGMLVEEAVRILNGLKADLAT